MTFLCFHPSIQMSTLLFMALLVLSTHAFPGGVGGCAPNRAAVEGPHLATPARQTGPIGNARLQMVLDDDIVLRSAERANFTIGEDHTLTLRKIDDEGTSFRGFLFRLGPGDDDGVDTTDAFQPIDAANSSIAFEHCIMGQGVGGLSHSNARLKESMSGILRMDEVATNMPLDVTVVIQNRNGLSEFYYQQFLLNAVTGPTGPGGEAPPRVPTLPPLPPALAPALPPAVLDSVELSSTECTEQYEGTVVRDTGDGAILNPEYVCESNGEPPLGTVTPQEGSIEGEVCCGPPTTAVVPPTPTPAIAQQKVAPEAKCGSLASDGGRGGSAADSKGCVRRQLAEGTLYSRRKPLKGSN